MWHNHLWLGFMINPKLFLHIIGYPTLSIIGYFTLSYYKLFILNYFLLL
jgi:hypothetical protein